MNNYFIIIVYKLVSMLLLYIHICCRGSLFNISAVLTDMIVHINLGQTWLLNAHCDHLQHEDICPGSHKLVSSVVDLTLVSVGTT